MHLTRFKQLEIEHRAEGEKKRESEVNTEREKKDRGR